MGWCPGFTCSLELATQTAAWAVGLPLEPTSIDWPDPYNVPRIQGYDSSGQARAVVALWLGAQSSPGLGALFQSRIAGDAQQPDASKRGGAPFLMQGCESVIEPGTLFAVQDGLFARQLLQRDGDHVAQVINEHWRELTDPRTSSDVVATLFGLRRAEPRELLISFSIC